MSRSTNSDYERYRSVGMWVDDAVTYYRNLGHKRNVPFEQTALSLGVNGRKIKAIFYGEAVNIFECEYRRIRDRFVQHLEDRASDYVRRADAVKAKLRQMEML